MADEQNIPNKRPERVVKVKAMNLIKQGPDYQRRQETSEKKREKERQKAETGAGAAKQKRDNMLSKKKIEEKTHLENIKPLIKEKKEDETNIPNKIPEDKAAMETLKLQKQLQEYQKKQDAFEKKIGRGRRLKAELVDANEKERANLLEKQVAEGSMKQKDEAKIPNKITSELRVQPPAASNILGTRKKVSAPKILLRDKSGEELARSKEAKRRKVEDGSNRAQMKGKAQKKEKSDDSDEWTPPKKVRDAAKEGWKLMMQEPETAFHSDPDDSTDDDYTPSNISTD